MINNLGTFTNDELNVTFTARECNGKFLFPVAPVIRALNYTNSTKALENVFSEYQFRFRDITGRNGKPTLFLSEPGLYQLIIKSKKKEAIKFQKWVFEEVLPNIRLNGGYIMGQEKLPEDERNKLIAEIKSLRNSLSITTEAFQKLSDRVVDLANDLTMSSIDENIF